MMKTIASKLQRKRVALVVALGVSVMIFATVVEEITGDLPLRDEHGRRSLAAYFGSWDMLQKDIRDTKSKKRTSSTLRKEASESLKTVTEEFKGAAVRVRNENFESGLEVFQQFEDEVESLRRKFNQEEKHTSDLLHELYDDKKHFDSNFDAAIKAHDYERETVVGEIKERLNESHQELDEAERKKNADLKEWGQLIKVRRRGKRVVDQNYRIERKKRAVAASREIRAARAKARQAARARAKG